MAHFRKFLRTIAISANCACRNLQKSPSIRTQSVTSFSCLKKLNKKDTENIRVTLEDIVGKDKVTVADAVRSQHGQDEGPEVGSPPDIVVFPQQVEHVQEICKICNSHKIAIIPHGTGTGLEAGISAIQGGICVDVSQMNQISNYHPEDFDVVVEPGVTREDLNHHVKNEGLWFPVDPGSNPSICGMCATSASGTNAVRYGTIKENCINLEVVLADGRVIYTGGENKRPRKSSAGYNLTNLIVGSEGTLGIITKATVRLHAIPEATAAAVVSFPNIQAAVDTVVMTMQSSIPMARMELLDPLSIKANNEYSKLSLKEEPTLFLEFHGSESSLEAQTKAVAEIAEGNGGSTFEWALQQEDRNRLWKARHKLHYACLNLKPGSRSVTTDVCVPISNLPQMAVETRKDIDQAGITGPIFGHVGDGNFHAYLLFDPNNKDGYRVCKDVANRMGRRALALGGTCTGEHGVGTGKIKLLEQQFGENGMDVMRSIKTSLDPNGIMNPGKVLAQF